MEACNGKVHSIQCVLWRSACPKCSATLQINDWLLRARDANPGDLPELPSTSEGGSKLILQEAPAAAQNVTPPPAAKGTARPSGKAAQPSAKRGKNAGELVEVPQRHVQPQKGLLLHSSASLRHDYVAENSWILALPVKS